VKYHTRLDVAFIKGHCNKQEIEIPKFDSDDELLTHGIEVLKLPRVAKIIGMMYMISAKWPLQPLILI
jgi:hypothetical protein